MTEMHPREAARRAGARTYFSTGCKLCGGTERYTNNGSCVLCQRARGSGKAVSPYRAPSDRDQERRDMRARLALRRAEQSAKQRRAMGLPG